MYLKPPIFNSLNFLKVESGCSLHGLIKIKVKFDP